MATVVTDQERVRRVREEGSRRKRDVAAYRRVKAARAEQLERERLDRLASLTPKENTDMRATWARVVLLLWQAVPDSTFAIWLSPLRFVGTDGETCLLAAPEGIATWVERRYSALIREALQTTESGYNDVEFVSAGEEETCR
jgi:DnaA N-terminal domain